MMLTSFPVNYPEMVVEKSEGLTVSEKKLAALGYRTFLRLWSYPNPYKMQLNGKELCDLLIAFDNHIIIFSDKDCAYGNSGDPRVDWRRWYKRAIQKSAEQLIGAKNWISRCPDRIAIDAKCSKKLPLEIKITSKTKFHLIAIAHGATEPCKAYFSGGDGGFLINNRIIGNMHVDEGCEPFCVGRVLDNAQDFIHVFDDSSYINVLRELDTIQDFIGYLDARQTLLTGKGVIAESENDILAQHLRGVIKGNACILQEISREYRAVRKEMLADYCAITKVEYPEVSHIIGVAHESAEGQYTSEDFIYLDASEWSTEQQAGALALKKEYEERGLLKKRSMIPRTFFAEKPKMKGRDRNKPCPCGSGRKFKNCCGQD